MISPSEPAPPPPPPPDPAPPPAPGDDFSPPLSSGVDGYPGAVELPELRAGNNADRRLVSEFERLRKSGDRLWLVSWDGQAYTVRVVGQIRRRVTVDPP